MGWSKVINLAEYRTARGGVSAGESVAGSGMMPDDWWKYVEENYKFPEHFRILPKEEEHD